MTVHNTSGAKTLFIYLAAIVVSAAYALYCKTVGPGNADDDVDDGRLIRPEAWYAVDISMVLNSMTNGRGVTALMRMQLCAPPMPTKQEVYDYLDSWYEKHKLSSCTLVFVFDGRRCPYKMRNEESRQKREQAFRERDSARNYEDLEKALKKLVDIDADVLYWAKQWVSDMDHSDRIFLVGAPYEADAQLVELERSGIVDGIITDDGACIPSLSITHTHTHAHTHTDTHLADAWFLGGNNILKGFTTRKTNKYGAILGGQV